LRKRAIDAVCALPSAEQIQFLDSLAEERPVESGMDSSMTGLEILYFSLAQLPRSVKRQRSLQKGKSSSFSESVGFRQIGHGDCMSVSLA
jgi:hypothetical protein